MYGSSSVRNAGSCRKVSASSVRRDAETSAVVPASRTKRVTSSLRASSSPITRSASVMNLSIVSV